MALCKRAEFRAESREQRAEFRGQNLEQSAEYFRTIFSVLQLKYCCLAFLAPEMQYW
jgi:hypothetical protein